MLEIVELIRPAKQGRTIPFLCKASDGNAYFIKGYATTVSGLMKEWLGANLAKAFGLPISPFEIAFLDERLVQVYGGLAISELKSGYVFASKQILAASELKFETVKKIDQKLKLSILLFDLWVQNEDRTLTETGGNPNLLWKADNEELFIIDHNLIFDMSFNKLSFFNCHVFKSVIANKQGNWIEQNEFECLMLNALKCWQPAMDNLPEDWLELNNELSNFNPEQHRQRLEFDANGNIWSKLP